MEPSWLPSIRRWLGLLAIGLLAMGLVACSGTESASSTEDAADTSADRASSEREASESEASSETSANGTNDTNDTEMSDERINVTEADSVPLSQSDLIGVWQTPTSEEQQQAFQYVFHRDETFAIYRANSDILAMNGDYRLDEDERELRLYVREAGSETLLSLQRLKPVAKRENGDQLIFKRMGEGDALWLGRTSETPELQTPSEQTSPPDN